MREACRVLKAGGLLWCKCKDEIECGKQRISHIEIHNIAAIELNMTVQDLFILTPDAAAIVQHEWQHHARKNHSYLWLFKKKSKGKGKG